jgi:hypothetical protein
LAVDSDFTAGLLSVTANAADNIAITFSGGNVLVNGDNPGGGPVAVLATNVIRIDVVASGAFANDIDLN